MTNLMPHNPTTDRAYTGTNITTLVFAQEMAEYTTAEWAGYNQWLEAGRQVRKGEKSTAIVMVVPVKDKDAKGNKTERKTRRPKTIRVFNIAQTDPVAEEVAA